VRGIEAGRALPGDEGRIAELLELNGLPRHMAAEERFLIAGWGGEVLAALHYRAVNGRLLLGCLASDPFASERLLARALHAEAHALAREMGLKEIRALPPVHGAYPYDGGHRSRYRRWRPGAAAPIELDGGLPEGGWRRVLALWGFVSIPFFRAFRAP